MDFRIKETRKTVEDVPGWLTRSEGKLLFNLAKSCAGRGVIVEIGSWKGKSTIWLAKGSQAGQNAKVYAIDPHAGTSEHRRQGKISTFEEFERNISQAGVTGSGRSDPGDVRSRRIQLRPTHRDDFHRRRPRLRSGEA